MKLSDFTFKPLYDGVQMLLQFDTLCLSIVQHSLSYGGKAGLYEIAVMNDTHQIELPGVTKEGDTVKGYLTESDVNAIIKKMHTLTRAIPKQVTACL
jgi:hypothetical protein